MRFLIPSATLLVFSACFAAAEAPEKILATLLKKMNGRAVRIEGVIAAEKSIQVKGVVHGADSDLTVTTQEGKSVRTVIFEGHAWTSSDGTKWQSVAQIDRSFPRLMMGPIIFNGKMPPPFEEVDRKTEDGVVLQHIQLKVPKGDKSSDRPNYWLAFRGRQPLEIRRAEVPMILGGHTMVVKADYRTEDVPAIAVPKGAPEPAAPLSTFSPETLLVTAKNVMTTLPAVKVSATIQGDKEFKVTGMLEGQNCDLTVVADGHTELRQKVIGEDQFTSTDDSKSWKKTKPERDYFYLVNTPIAARKDETIPPFEIVNAKEETADTSVVQIRFKAPEAVSAEGDRPNYWIAISKGQPIGIRRYHGPMGFRGKYVTGIVEYEAVPSAPEEKPRIVAPKTTD